MAQTVKTSLDDQDVAPEVIKLQNNLQYHELTTTAVTTAGNGTYTAAALVNGVILRSGHDAAVTEVMPTATNFVNAIPNCAVGDHFVFWIRNLNTSLGAITLGASTGVTLSGTTTCAINKTRMYVGKVTAIDTPAVTIYGVMLGDV
jgi:hypothetical protein